MFWLAQTFIAELVQKDVRMLNERLVNIFDEGELRREATIRELRTIRAEQRLLAGVCRRARSPAAEERTRDVVGFFLRVMPDLPRLQAE